MTCAYQDCGGEIDAEAAAGRCLTCGRPVFLCPACGAANRTFARHCRRCNRDISFPDAGLVFGGGSSAELSVALRHVSISKSFWVSPLAYRGFLWCLSAAGEVLVFSPFEQHARHFATLGEGFGKSAFTVTPLAGDEAGNMPPYLLALSPGGMSGLNLLTGKAVKFLGAADNERLLSNSEEGYAAVESRGRAAFFLKRRGHRLQLCAFDLLSLEAREYALPEDEVVGPLLVGERVAVYSRSALYVLKAGAAEEAVKFPRQFRAWMSPGEYVRLQPRVGRQPFLVRQNSVYIPGTAGGEPGFLYVTLWDGGTAAATFFPIAGEACYSQDAAGSLLVARAGGVDLYEGAAPLTVRNDPQVDTQAPAYHDERLTVFFTKTAGGVKAIRLYRGNAVRDYSLAQLGEPVAMEFLAVVGALALPYLVEGDGGSRMGIAIWDAR